MKHERARVIVFSSFAGVLAFLITPIIVIPITVTAGRSYAVLPGMSIFYIIIAVIPLIVAALTFAFFSVKKERREVHTR